MKLTSNKNFKIIDKIEVNNPAIQISSVCSFMYLNVEYISCANWEGNITIYKITESLKTYSSLKTADFLKANILTYNSSNNNINNNNFSDTYALNEPILYQSYYNDYLYLGTALGAIYVIPTTSLFTKQGYNNVNIFKYIGKHEIGCIFVKVIPTIDIMISAGWDGFLNFWYINKSSENNSNNLMNINMSTNTNTNNNNLVINLIYSFNLESKILAIGNL